MSSKSEEKRLRVAAWGARSALRAAINNKKSMHTATAHANAFTHWRAYMDHLGRGDEFPNEFFGKSSQSLLDKLDELTSRWSVK